MMTMSTQIVLESKSGLYRLLAGILGLVTLLAQPGVYAATATATVTVDVVSTIRLNNITSMVFGDISSSASSGTVILNPTGARLSTGGVTINTAVPGSAATFDVMGDPNATYAITLPAAITLTNPLGNSMLVDNLNSTPSSFGNLDASGQSVLQVGGTLNVDPNQIFGSYSGLMSVTVEYN
jgi:hypothetical protein